MAQVWARAGRVRLLQEMGPSLLGNRISNEIYSGLQIECVVALLIMTTSNICLEITLCQALCRGHRHSPSPREPSLTDVLSLQQ